MDLIAAATTSAPSVPFLDLAPAHNQLAPQVLRDIAELIETGGFTNGPAVAEFEHAFAQYCHTRLCVGLASGLDALRLGLLAAGIESGCDVIVPAMTFIATLEAVTQAGACPVVVDVTCDDYNLDVAAAEAAVTARTRLLLPVHLYGQMADMRQLVAAARRHGLGIIEDACQAHGSERDGYRAGAVGTVGAFSFYPSKNLGAFGDAGAVVTNDDDVAATVRSLREHGQRLTYQHDIAGYTARLDTIQALVLTRKLAQLDAWNRQRQRAARYYTQALAGLGDLVLPSVPAGSSPVWHLYVIRTAHPDRLAAALARDGIATRRHYPYAVHRTGAFATLGYRRGAFPVAERLSREVVSLPMFPSISEAQLSAVTDAATRYFRDG